MTSRSLSKRFSSSRIRSSCLWSLARRRCSALASSARRAAARALAHSSRSQSCLGILQPGVDAIAEFVDHNPREHRPRGERDGERRVEEHFLSWTE